MSTIAIDDWTSRLAAAIAASLSEFAPRIRGETIAILAVDCHPWHGRIALAILTAAEVNADSQIASASEMAAWRHYDFAQSLTSWRPAMELGRHMQSAYEAGDRPAVADAFLSATAAAVSSNFVREALEQFARTEDFQISVAHPDDGREFVLPLGR